MIKTIITTSWDDGHPSDLKLAELLSRYNIPATFYIPIANNERDCMSPAQIREIAQSYDIGSHSYQHTDLTRIPAEAVETEVMAGKQKLEDMIGRELLSFCYPIGSFNNTVASIVKRAGFIGARTSRLLNISISNPFKMGTTFQAAKWHLIPYIKQSVDLPDLRLFRFMLRKNLFLKAWDQIAMASLDFVAEYGGIWHLWGHSWEISANDDWRKLENVLSRASALSGKAKRMSNSQLLALYNNSKLELLE